MTHISLTVDLCCREMVKNILGPVVDSDTELVRYDVHHALPNNTNSLIGNAPFSLVLLFYSVRYLFHGSKLTIIKAACLNQKQADRKPICNVKICNIIFRVLQNCLIILRTFHIPVYLLVITACSTEFSNLL
jgi:hypothetical protein